MSAPDTRNRPGSDLDFGPALNSVLDTADEWRRNGSYPLFPVVDEPRLTTARINGTRQVTVFGSADYLGLGRHPEVLEAAATAIQEYGTNSYGVQAVGGYTTLHDELENATARFFDRQDALLFPSGMQANIGVLASLVGPGDVILTDELNHGSIGMGARLSGAQIGTYRHNDPAHLDELLGRCPASARRLVVVDGLFSADGDIAPLGAIADLAEDHGALLMVDEAHAAGAIGDRGKGAAEHCDVLDRVAVITGTMSKTFVSTGGFACAAPRTVDLIRHTSGAYLLSLGLAPPTVAASLAALRVASREGHERRCRLHRNAARLRAGLTEAGVDIGACEAHVVVAHIGEVDRTAFVAKALSERGLLVGPLFPPAVPIGDSRLRLGVSAAHTDAEIDRAAELLADVLGAGR